MDFGGLLGFDGSSVSHSDPDINQRLYGSALCNTITHQEDDDNDDDSRRKRIVFKKMTKSTDDLSAIRHTTSLMRSNGGHPSDSQQMLCFSSPNSLPYYHGAYARNNTASGYGSSMHGIKGPFTPSQWMELEHQALIYKYITANAPVPSNLLIPIRKALESDVFSCFPGSHLRPNFLGWGAFHLGFSNTDPEPGRCRRTDGKKWRCSKDAVIDQKYCERHMNRGRHRSRKHVEGQSGQSSASRPPTTTTTAASKVVLPSSSTQPMVVPGSNASNNLNLNNLQLPSLNRSFMNNENGLKRDQFSIPKQHNLYEQTSLSEFGLVSSNSLLNPLHKTYQDLNQETKSNHSLRQFMDDWPKNQSDRTELSISIPMPSSDIMSSTSSPTNEKLIPLSPLRLSCENVDPTQMETNIKKQENWVPKSWENAMGGPLGEVLHSTNNSNSAGDYKGTSALNLMTEGWDSFPSIASSPTGVLQKTTFRSLSNSSAGSSPRITSLAQI